MTLTFDGDGMLYGMAGVNRVRATWAADEDDQLAVGPLVSTMMAGPTDAMAAERALLALLSAPLAATVDDGGLRLVGQDGPGDDVCGSPGDRGECGDGHPAPFSFHGSYYTFQGSYSGAVTENPDHVARIQEAWRRERPDLDVAPQGVIGRLHRVAARLTEELIAVYRDHGLGEGDFDVLATLRRAGAPYERTAGELAEHTMITTGGMTKRIDRLEAAGLGMWRPENFGGKWSGPRTLRYGIQFSKNLMTVRLAKDVGMPLIAEYARRFGIYDDLQPVLSRARRAERPHARADPELRHLLRTEMEEPQHQRAAPVVGQRDAQDRTAAEAALRIWKNG